MPRENEGGRETITEPDVEVVARYAEDDLLTSGWAMGEERHLAGAPAVMNVELGLGRRRRENRGLRVRSGLAARCLSLRSWATSGRPHPSRPLGLPRLMSCKECAGPRGAGFPECVELEPLPIDEWRRLLTHGRLSPPTRQPAVALSRTFATHLLPRYCDPPERRGDVQSGRMPRG